MFSLEFFRGLGRFWSQAFNRAEQLPTGGDDDGGGVLEEGLHISLRQSTFRLGPYMTAHVFWLSLPASTCERTAEAVVSKRRRRKTATRHRRSTWREKHFTHI